MTEFKISYAESAGTQLGRIFLIDLYKNLQPFGRNPAVSATMRKCRNKTAKPGASPINTDDTKPLVVSRQLEVPASQQDGADQNVAGPSFGRVGIYI